MSMSREELEKRRQEYEEHVEKEMLRRHGPPEKRERMTRAHVGALVARWTEPEVRRILAECCALGKESIYALERLPRDHKLDSDPLDQIIRPYDYFGFHFDIEPHQPGLAGSRYKISFGEAEDTCGSGGAFEAVLDADGKLQIGPLCEEWIA